MQFHHLNKVHFQLAGFYPPCSYAMILNKNEHTRQQFPNRLSQLTESAKPNRILLKVERAALNVFSFTTGWHSLKDLTFTSPKPSTGKLTKSV